MLRDVTSSDKIVAAVMFNYEGRTVRLQNSIGIGLAGSSNRLLVLQTEHGSAKLNMQRVRRGFCCYRGTVRLKQKYQYDGQYGESAQLCFLDPRFWRARRSREQTTNFVSFNINHR